MAQIKKDIKYLNKDFGQYRANLIEFAKNYFPNTYNDFNESSPGMMFVEMAAYVGDVLSYYTDNQLKESLLEFASNRPNVLALASTSGYKSKNTIPASVILDVFQLLPAKSTAEGKVPDYSYALTIKEGMLVRAENNNEEFRTLNLINFNINSTTDPTEVSVYQVNENTAEPEYFLLKKQVKAISGKLNTATFTFENAKRFDKILIEDTNIIDIVSIIDSDMNDWTEVPYLAQDVVFETVANTVQNDPQLSQYTNVPYLLKLKKTARRFITKFRADKNLEIQFGPGITDTDDEELIPNPDNVGSSLNGLQIQFDHPIDSSNFMYTKSYGLAPSNTILTVTYSSGGGVQSNVPSYSLTLIGNINIDIDSQLLDSTLLTKIKSSVACTNPEPASGGKSEESLEEIRQNAMSTFATQQRAVTAQDYIVRAYSLPAKFGSISKAYVIQDQQINPDNGQEMIPNPLAINLYTLGYDLNGNLIPLNDAVKNNLKTYINQYRILTDAINIKTASIINIGIKFEIITLPEYNSNEVILNCLKQLKTTFDNKSWQINQPIVLSKIYTELDRVKGVQSVTSVKIVNLYNTDEGYSGNVYDITAATKGGIIYPSLDPSIFEVKFMNQDIAGKVVSL
jgi:phage-related baseplate assembly protein